MTRDRYFKYTKGLLLLLEKSFCRFHQHRRANRQSALIQIKPGMMEQVTFMPLLLCAKGKHRSGCMFEKFTEILRTESFFNLLDVFNAKHVLACFFDHLRYHFVIDHGRTADLKFQFVIST